MILRIILTFLLLFSSSAVIALSISEDENSLQITSLMSAVIDGDVQSVDFFSKSDSEQINEKNIGGASALALACRKDNAEIVKILINNGAIVNNVDNEGWTPLMRAANGGNYEIVEILLNAKADVTKVNSQKEGALIYATKSSCVKCFKAIFAKFDLTHFLTTELLRSQLNDSFALAKKQGNAELQNIISAQLALIIDEKTQDSKLDKDFKIVESNFAVEEVVKNNKKLPKKSKKNFVFQPVEDKKPSAKEVKVESDLMENNQVKKFAFKAGEEKMPPAQESLKVAKALEKPMEKNSEVKKFTFKAGEKKLEKPVEKLLEKSAEKPLEKIAEKPVKSRVVKNDSHLEIEENTEKKFILNKVQ